MPSAIERLEKLRAEAPHLGRLEVQQSHGRDCVWTDVIDATGDDVLNFETNTAVEICSVDHRCMAQLDIDKTRAIAELFAAAVNALPALLACAKALEKLLDACNADQSQLDTSSAFPKAYQRASDALRQLEAVDE